GGDAALRREVEERVADLSFLCKVEEARIEGAAVRADGEGFDSARSVPLFRQAFQEYGIDVLAGDGTAVAEQLRRRTVRAEAAAALSDWWFSSDDKAEKQRLGQLVEALDPEGITAQVRRAGRARDAEALKRLA